MHQMTVLAQWTLGEASLPPCRGSVCHTPCLSQPAPTWHATAASAAWSFTQAVRQTARPQRHAPSVLCWHRQGATQCGPPAPLSTKAWLARMGAAVTGRLLLLLRLVVGLQACVCCAVLQGVAAARLGDSSRLTRWVQAGSQMLLICRRTKTVAAIGPA
jgi:hypothetical protein